MRRRSWQHKRNAQRSLWRKVDERRQGHKEKTMCQRARLREAEVLTRDIRLLPAECEDNGGRCEFHAWSGEHYFYEWEDDCYYTVDYHSDNGSWALCKKHQMHDRFTCVGVGRAPWPRLVGDHTGIKHYPAPLREKVLHADCIRRAMWQHTLWSSRPTWDDYESPGTDAYPDVAAALEVPADGTQLSFLRIYAAMKWHNANDGDPMRINEWSIAFTRLPRPRPVQPPPASWLGCVKRACSWTPAQRAWLEWFRWALVEARLRLPLTPEPSLRGRPAPLVQ